MHNSPDKAESVEDQMDMIEIDGPRVSESRDDEGQACRVGTRESHGRCAGEGILPSSIWMSFPTMMISDTISRRFFSRSYSTVPTSWRSRFTSMTPCLDRRTTHRASASERKAWALNPSRI